MLNNLVIGEVMETKNDIKPCEHLHWSWDSGIAKARLEWMAGSNWSLIWLNCPDLENLIATGFTQQEVAAQWAKNNNITVVDVNINTKGK